MLQEAPQKLFGRECHDAWPAAVRLVFPAETHFGIRDREQAVVGDGDAMRVAGQIVKDVLWSAEGWLGIDDPVLLKQSAQKGDEVLLDCEWTALTIEQELVAAKSTPQSRHELAAENTAEDFDGEEETGARGDPARVVRGTVRLRG